MRSPAALIQWSVVCCLAALWPAIAAAPATAQAYTRLNVVLTDGASQPLTGVTFSLTADDGTAIPVPQQPTDQTGVAAFPYVPVGSTITIESPDAPPPGSELVVVRTETGGSTPLEPPLTFPFRYESEAGVSRNVFIEQRAIVAAPTPTPTLEPATATPIPSTATATLPPPPDTPTPSPTATASPTSTPTLFPTASATSTATATSPATLQPTNAPATTSTAPSTATTTSSPAATSTVPHVSLATATLSVAASSTPTTTARPTTVTSATFPILATPLSTPTTTAATTVPEPTREPAIPEPTRSAPSLPTLTPPVLPEQETPSTGGSPVTTAVTATRTPVPSTSPTPVTPVETATPTQPISPPTPPPATVPVPLSGAVVVSYRDVAGQGVAGSWFRLDASDCQAPFRPARITDARGSTRFDDVPRGTYCLVETQAAVGYASILPRRINVDRAEVPLLVSAVRLLPSPGLPPAPPAIPVTNTDGSVSIRTPARDLHRTPITTLPATGAGPRHRPSPPSVSKILASLMIAALLATIQTQRPPNRRGRHSG